MSWSGSNAKLPTSSGRAPLNGVNSISQFTSQSIFHREAEIEQQNKFRQEEVY